MVSTNPQTLHRDLANAREKLIEATLQQARKAPAFEADVLFTYLWDRAWGTSEYEGRGLVRLVDGWIARLCSYREARTAYWLLNEIPRRLQQRIDQLEQQLADTAA